LSTSSNYGLVNSTAIYSGTMSWESALSDVLSVLKIQYRSEPRIVDFLENPEQVRQLTHSAIARMEYNRRCVREEVDSGIYSPPRARRIAKEVAIDYIRRFLDGEEDRIELISKLDKINAERDVALETVNDIETENKILLEEKDHVERERDLLANTKNEIESKLNETHANLEQTKAELNSTSTERQKLHLTLESANKEIGRLNQDNNQLRKDLASLKADFEKLRHDNSTLRNECKEAWEDCANKKDIIAKLRRCVEDEQRDAGKIKAENDRVTIKNNALSAENKEVKEKNLSLRDANHLLKAREDEMRGLVAIQLELLAPEKHTSDLKSIVRQKEPEFSPVVETEEPEEVAVAESSENQTEKSE